MNPPRTPAPPPAAHTLPGFSATVPPTRQVLLTCLLLTLAGCGKSSDTELPVAQDPQAAATQLESAFSSASAEARQAAAAAAEALRTKNYEKAVASLEVARSGPGVSLEQGVAVHSSVVALESELILAAQNGDPKARRAYELLKALKAK